MKSDADAKEVYMCLSRCYDTMHSICNCNTLQHTVTHRNTLQHTDTMYSIRGTMSDNSSDQWCAYSGVHTEMGCMLI